MSSIMTNAGAMTALQTLKATNKSLEETQGRISTGFRVSEAAHNAAYWSIATTMRSDNNAMSTVKDALGLGAAQVDIAYTAMDAVKDTLDEIKKKLVAASEPDVDKSKIQSEIEQLQNDLKTFAKSATFSGGNWLDVNGNAVQKVVASFIRSDTGAISLGTIDIDTASVALFNAKAGENGGLLQGGTHNTGLGGLAVGAQVTGANGTAASQALGVYAATTMWAEDQIVFDLTFNGETRTIRVNGPATATAAPAALSTADFGTSVQAAIDAAFGSGKLTFTVGTGIIASATATGAAQEGETVTVDGLYALPAKTDILTIDITNVTNDQLRGLINGVDRALSAVTTAASDLGAIKTRIASQQDFVGKIMDAVSRGVGQLVDADMEEESTRLQALQVQQQLGIQALSIANGNAQNILSLFRN